MTDIVYATTNPGKFAEVQKLFVHQGIEIKSAADFDIKIDVEETGTSLEENAALKALAYQKVLPSDVVVIGDDTGIEIDALGGEPGITVRRWKGYSMEDEEIIEYALERLKDVPKDERGAQFRTVLAVASHGKPVAHFSGVLRGEILETPRPEREKGMPFWPIFFLPDLNMTLGEFHDMPIDFQVKNPTHRKKAVISALPYLATLTN